MSAQKPPRVKNLTYVGLASQAGCVTLALVLGALIVGLWLDHHFGVKGPFTVGLLIVSVPVSLFLMTRIALKMFNQLQAQQRPKPTDNSPKED